MLRFADLFAGLGGFHLALKELGHECVIACEIIPALNALYKQNFGITPKTDIRKIPVKDVPDHDILCAGFPCQPFSKAGSQKGTDCPVSGDLFEYVLHIIREKNPTFFILENVPNLMRHADGATWRRMKRRLERATKHNSHYYVEARMLSPHQFGIPQIRERLFVVGSQYPLDSFKWPEPKFGEHLSITSALDHNPPEARQLSKQVTDCLDVWQEFLSLFRADEDLPSYPLWTMEFGATYPHERHTPYSTPVKMLRECKGACGVSLDYRTRRQVFECLPSHACRPQKVFPDWKQQFIRQNREFYTKYKDRIDPWLPKIRQFPPSLQKFEWNCKGEQKNLWDLVIQFRASGVRVKRPSTSPSLVAMTTTQVPIIAWEKRYMTPRECARLQSMGALPDLPESDNVAFTALGNAVNVDLVKMIAKELLPAGGLPEPDSVDVHGPGLTETPHDYVRREVGVRS